MAVRIRKDVLNAAIQDSSVCEKLAVGILYGFPAIYSYPDDMTLYLSVMSPSESSACYHLKRLFGCQLEYHDGTEFPYVAMKAHQFKTVLDACCKKDFTLGANLNTIAASIAEYEKEVTSQLLSLGLLSGERNVFVRAWAQYDELRNKANHEFIGEQKRS